MTPGSASWQPLLIAATLATLTLWLNHATNVAVIRDDGGFSHTPDYYIDNFRATAFDADGHPLHVLRAKRMVHYMDDDTTSLIEPHYAQQRPGRPAIEASARRGMVSGNGDHVHFLDQVTLTRQSDAGPTLMMRTEYLHIIPDAEQIQTDKPLEITQGQSNLSANGLFADGQSHTLILRGRVRGNYRVSH
jgi:lipopolysaccharide export system protein LptC